MAIKTNPATLGRATHKSGMTSKLAKFDVLRGPDTRHPKTHGYSVPSAESQVKKMG